MNVVLPAPLRPSRPIRCPGSIWHDTPSSSGGPRKPIRKSVTVTRAMATTTGTKVLTSYYYRVGPIWSGAKCRRRSPLSDGFPDGCRQRIVRPVAAPEGIDGGSQEMGPPGVADKLKVLEDGHGELQVVRISPVHLAGISRRALHSSGSACRSPKAKASLPASRG